MAKIFITGSTDGLGQLAAKTLIDKGHQVVLHARSEERAKQASGETIGAIDILIGDLSSIEETKALAAKANAIGKFDAVIHNAGVYQPTANPGTERLPVIFTVNSLAPYILSSMMYKPERLIYISSGMHRGGDATLDNMPSENKKSHRISYSDTKLHNVILSMAVSRRWTDVFVNAIDPGWVPTKMGGRGAPDDLEKGYETQVWLAESQEPGAMVSGKYFYHKKQKTYHHIADEIGTQDKFLMLCKNITGVRFGE